MVDNHTTTKNDTNMILPVIYLEILVDPDHSRPYSIFEMDGILGWDSLSIVTSADKIRNLFIGEKHSILKFFICLLNLPWILSSLMIVDMINNNDDDGDDD